MAKGYKIAVIPADGTGIRQPYQFHANGHGKA